MDNRNSKNGTADSINGVSPSHSEKSIKRIYKQIYRKDWEKNPIFQGWLSPVANDKYKAECTACRKEVIAHRLTLLKHASSAKHLKRVSMACNLTANKANRTQPHVPVTKNISVARKTTSEQLEINETSSNDDENTINLPQLVKLNNANPRFTAKIKIGHHGLNHIEKAFAEEIEAELSQFAAEEIATNNILERAVSSIQPTSTSVTTNPASKSIPKIVINPDSLNIKQGYVTRNKIPRRIISATFLGDEVRESSNLNTLKISYPLQISTRVTDYSRGISVVNLAITLYMLTGGKWISVGESVTDDVGRCNMYHKNDTFFSVGMYKLHYDVATYYDQQNLESYFPFVEIVFQVKSLHETHHIPLMISPNGYTACRNMDY